METKKHINLRSLFDNKKFVLLFSIITAIVFWIIITVTESPNSENTIAGLNVAIPTENSAVSELGLDVIDDTENLTAAVTIKGPAYVVGSIGSKDLAVSASLSNVTSAGTYELELKATKLTSKIEGEFEIVSISPSTIKVTFDYIDTKQFTVVPMANGASAVEGLVAEAPIVSDSNNATLTFKGSRTDMEKIDKVVAVAEVNEVLEKTESFDSNIIIYDKDENVVSPEKYTITTADGVSSPDVKVTVPISMIKEVSIKAQFTNVPEGIKKISHSLNYYTVDIIGAPEAVKNITYISLAPIDMYEVSENYQTFPVKMVLPDGVKCVENIEDVEVKITGLSGYTVKTYTVSKIKAANKTAFSVSLSKNIRNVKICGPTQVMNKLYASNLYAEVDMTGKKVGEHTVTVVIKCAESNKIWQVGTYTATVNIK